MGNNIRVTCRLASLVMFISVVAVSLAPAQMEIDLVDIINQVQRLHTGDSSTGVVRMEVVTEHWERNMTMEMASYGNDYALVRILTPAKESGTATLKADRDIWNYLPKIDRTIKVPASMMGGSWMGSHFTNDDLVQESTLTDEYDLELTFDGERDGASVWEITLIPKPETAVVWGSIMYRVRKDAMQPVSAFFYDEDGDLARSMEFTEPKRLGGRMLPSVMTMVPADKPDELTRMVYEELNFDVGLDESYFALRNLQDRR